MELDGQGGRENERSPNVIQINNHVYMGTAT